MEPFSGFPRQLAARVRFVMTDVDDTLTDGPRLPAKTYHAIERLQAAGIIVVPVTAAPAGWCDLMARMWPVGAVIGENGGLCFRHDSATGETARHYWLKPAERESGQARLTALAADIVATLPGCAVAHDQRYRETTLAFANRDPAEAEQILARLREAGMRSAVNSVWVLGWLGDFDKLSMTRRMLKELFGSDIERDAAVCVYVGDSPNDMPMFGSFPHSVGVANVQRYAGQMSVLPRWITAAPGGAGFVEVADALVAGRRSDQPLANGLSEATPSGSK